MVPAQDIAAYALALLVAAAVPGPGITALIARSAAQGAAAGSAMMFGLILGDLIYLTIAVFGLSLIAAHFGMVFTLIRVLSVAYLLWLAWVFWTSPPSNLTAVAVTRRTLIAAAVSGITLTLSNPKPIAFYLALMPLVLDLDQVTLGIWAKVLVPVTIGVLVMVGAVYITGASALRRWLTTTQALIWMNKGAAITMVVAAASMLIKAD